MRIPLAAIGALLIGASLQWTSANALAQSPFRGRPSTYTPPSKRPVISPYFDLLRSDNAGIPSYHMFLRQGLNLQQDLRHQQTTTQAQQLRLQNLERRLQQRQVLDVRRQPTRLQMRPAGRPATPVRSGTFMNFSHFYQGNQANRR